MNYVAQAVLVFSMMAAAAVPASALQPLVSGDAEIADTGGFEWYMAMQYDVNKGIPSRQLPTTELVYGLNERQEINFEIDRLSQGGLAGFENADLGTKYLLVKETGGLPAVALSFEAALPTASRSGGLGTGQFDYEFLMRTQKTWGRFTLFANLGFTVIGEPHVGGTIESQKNVWFASTAQVFAINKRTNLLSEVYFETAKDPGIPSQLAVNVGIDRELAKDFRLQAAAGTSLRGAQRGGPDFHLYAGFEWDFSAPWKTEKD